MIADENRGETVAVSRGYAVAEFLRERYATNPVRVEADDRAVLTPIIERSRDGAAQVQHLHLARARAHGSATRRQGAARTPHAARFSLLLSRRRPAVRRYGMHAVVANLLSRLNDEVFVYTPEHDSGAHDLSDAEAARARCGKERAADGDGEHVVGTIDDGWRLAKVTLGNERVSLSGDGALWGRGPTAHDVLDTVRRAGGTPDPVRRQRLASLYTEARILELIRMRTLMARLRGLEPGPEASVRKAISDPHGQHVMAMALELAGTDGMLGTWGPMGEASDMWPYGFLYSAALTIGGGTSEVQRNILGERVLGLPKDPAPPTTT